MSADRDRCVHRREAVHRRRRAKDHVWLAIAGARIFADVIDGARPDRNQCICGGRRATDTLDRLGIGVRMFRQDDTCNLAKALQGSLDTCAEDGMRRRVANNSQMATEG